MTIRPDARGSRANPPPRWPSHTRPCRRPFIPARWPASRSSETGPQALIRRAASGADPRGTTLPAWMAQSLPAEPTRSAAGGDAAAQEGSSGGRRRVLPALVPPAAPELVVVQFAQLVRVVVEPVSGVLHIVEVMAVLASGCLLLTALAHDRQLLPAQLGHLAERLL